MTSVEWLWEQIDNLIPYQDINSAQQFNGLLEQAKEMYKQEMATNCSQPVTNNHVFEISDEEIFEGIINHCKIQHDRISAEINAMIEGAKWYREQLKSKQ